MPIGQPAGIRRSDLNNEGDPNRRKTLSVRALAGPSFEEVLYSSGARAVHQNHITVRPRLRGDVGERDSRPDLAKGVVG
jgi:hypothetical protein